MSRRFDPQSGAAQLAPHPHRCELNAPPDALRFPQIRASCAGATSERLSFAKVFRRTTRQDLTRYEVLRVAMPCCASCQARHRAESPPRSRGADLATMIFSEAMLAALFPGATALFLLWIAAQALAGDAVERGAIVAGFAAILAVLALAAARWARASTERFRVPAQSSVTSSFDFSDNVAELLDRPRYVYALRDARFAAEFIAANRAVQWDPAQPAARRAARRRHLVMVLAIAVIAAFVVWQIAAAVIGGL